MGHLSEKVRQAKVQQQLTLEAIEDLRKFGSIKNKDDVRRFKSNVNTRVNKNRTINRGPSNQKGVAVKFVKRKQRKKSK